MQRRRLHWLFLAPWLASAFCAVACEREQSHVVVYVSADEQVAQPILAAFTKKTGIKVRPLFDTEVTKTTGLANRLRREKDRPVADVFWSSEPFAVEQLAQEDVLCATTSEALELHPTSWRDTAKKWYAFAGRARVIVYDPARLPKEDRPRAWTDLGNDRFRDQIVMADPRFGTTRGHMGAMEAFWSERAMPGYYQAWLEGLAENGVRMLPGGNSAVVDAVARGEALVGLTDTDDVWAAQAGGSQVALIYPRHDLEGEPGGGTLLVPNAVGVVCGGPNGEAAKRFLEYLVSQDVEQALYDSPSHNVPLVWTEAIEIQEPHRVDDPLQISISDAALAMDPAVKEAMKRLDPDRIASMRQRQQGRDVSNEEVAP